MMNASLVVVHKKFDSNNFPNDKQEFLGQRLAVIPTQQGAIQLPL